MLPAGRSRSAVLVSAFGRGVIAAGLGLGTLAVLVMVLWISSPYPDSGPDGAFHVATSLWLLAHGAELVRADTVGGHPSPMGAVPLLLCVLPVWLVHRAARDSADAAGEGDGDEYVAATDATAADAEAAGRHSAVGAFCAVSAGYLLVVLAAAEYARSGALPPARASLAFPVALVVTGAAAVGVWTARGRPLTPLLVWAPLRVQEAAARTRFRAKAGAAVRSASAGLLVLLGGGALLVAVALMWHAGAARESFTGLSGDWAGRVSVLLLAAALVPNAAMWGAAYGLGPGFALGTASTATPFAFTGPPALPEFPLLAAVPSHGPGTAVNWAAAAVPAVAALAVARFTARGAAPVRGMRGEAWSQGHTALVAGLAAVGCGTGAAVLAAASGGPLGTGALAEFGPVWWLVGPAALVWTAVVGVPAALLLRAWRLREQRWGWRWDAAKDEPVRAERKAEQTDRKDERKTDRKAERGAADGLGGADEEPELYDFLSADPWHEDGARETRWAALKKSSGGLMADFPTGPGPAPGVTATVDEPAPTRARPDATPVPETATPAPDAAPSREAASVQEAVPVREAASAKKSVPVREAASAKKSVPVREAAPVKKSVPVREAASVKKSVPVREAASVKKAAPVREAAPVQKTAPVREAAMPASGIPQAVPERAAESGAAAGSGGAAEPGERAGRGPDAPGHPDPGRDDAPR
ncbi:DUF6350 family protein [Streptomyces sp. NPDC001741]|uniref:cell division protein PerM n=1 Tax=Streptomyces sp. NPDC001741 TaxID=3364605 RepID=UPI003687038D